MSNRDLYKMIENLNYKIKKLDNQIKNKNFNIIPSNIKNSSQNISNTFKAYGILYPKTYDKNKRYIGLLFDENFNDFSSENNSNTTTKLPFIKLSSGSNIINYSLNIEIDNNINQNNQTHIYSISLGIKEKSNSKVRIIKGSKVFFDLNNKNIINNKITINNTILYSSQLGEELCMVVELGPKCKINSSKSLIKILTL
jgi:hypothetical protein